MNNPLISVIVPVYKAEAFLNRCVDSILNQTYRNLEIILVDDGSPDSCGQICDSYADMDSRIVVLHKENGGQSTARNAGLNLATGEYIGFVDSDDWIKPEMYEHLFSNLVREDAQISCCGIELDTESGIFGYLCQDLDAYKVFDTKQALCELPENQLVSNAAINKLYRRELLDELRFIEGMIYEDGVFSDMVIGLSSRTVCSGKPLYCYYIASESTTRGHVSRKQLTDIIIADDMRLNYYLKHCPEIAWRVHNNYFKDLLDLLIASVGYSEYKQERLVLRNKCLEMLDDASNEDYKRMHRGDIASLKLGLDFFDLKKKVRG